MAIILKASVVCSLPACSLAVSASPSLAGSIQLMFFPYTSVNCGPTQTHNPDAFSDHSVVHAYYSNVTRQMMCSCNPQPPSQHTLSQCSKLLVIADWGLGGETSPVSQRCVALSVSRHVSLHYHYRLFRILSLGSSRVCTRRT